MILLNSSYGREKAEESCVFACISLYHEEGEQLWKGGCIGCATGPLVQGVFSTLPLFSLLTLDRKRRTAGVRLP